MRSFYLPTIDHSLWPVAVVLVALVPLSFWHERNWRSTLAAYADARRAAGASDEAWPGAEVGWMLSLQPWLLAFAAALLAAMVALGATVMAVWPHRMPGFDETLNYFDRPYLGAMLVAGTAAVIGAIALAIDLWRSPWAGVAKEIRRSVYVTADERAERFGRALEADPGVPHESDELFDEAETGARELLSAG
jgi:hypothetical protein